MSSFGAIAKKLKGIAPRNALVEVKKASQSLAEQFDCPICRCELQNPVQTGCGHVFCKGCLETHCSGKSEPALCPLCNGKISSRKVVHRLDMEDLQKHVGKLYDAFQKEGEDFKTSKSNTDTAFQEQRKSDEGTRALTSLSLKGRGRRKVVPVTSNKVKTAADQPKVVINEQTPEIPTKDAAKVNFDKTNKSLGSETKNGGMNQKYILITASAVPVDENDVVPDSGSGSSSSPGKPLDLSFSRNGASLKYIYTSAVKYIKPLDLSMKKEKRKLEDATGAVKSNLPGDDRNKRIRYESAEKETDSNAAPKPDPSAEKNLPLSLKKTKKQEIVPSDNNQDKNKHALGGKNLTNSDELLRNIPEDVVNGRLQQKLTKTHSAKKNQKEDEPVFKPPHPSPKLKEKKGGEYTAQGKKISNQEILIDSDDEFQQPRDSDLLFLDVNYGSSSCRPPNKMNEETEDNLHKTKKTTKITPAAGEDSVVEIPEKDDSFELETENDLNFNNRFSQLRHDADKRISQNSQSQSQKIKFKDIKAAATATSGQKVDNNDSSRQPKPKSASKEKTKSVDKDRFFGFDEDDEDDEEFDKFKANQNSRETLRHQSTVIKELPITTKQLGVVEANDKRGQNVSVIEDNKNFVFCPTRLNKDQMTKLQHLCEMCDGEMSQEFNSSVTHLIINLSSGRVPHTLKYLLAIAGRKWVVIFDWVEQCLEKGEMIPETKFETSNFKQCDPGVKLSRLSTKNLFEGFWFYFASDYFKRQMGFTTKEVFMLMETLGAEVIKTVENHRSVLIVGSNKENETEYYNWLHTKKWITITFEWIIECILEYKLQPLQKQHLCIDVATNELQNLDIPKSLKTVMSTSSY